MIDYRRLIGVLADAGVEFIIVGGAAATAHGSSRLTEDLDIVYNRASVNITRLVDALAPFKPYPRDVPDGLPFKWEQETVLRGLNFTLRTTLGPVDLFGEIILGGNYKELLPYTFVLKLFGYDCRCLNLPRLIDVKRATGRPKDLEVVAELEAILEEQNN